ncbi:MAG: hypothetical protein U0X75_18915 [Acidobacteriota bacterium]
MKYKMLYQLKSAHRGLLWAVLFVLFQKSILPTDKLKEKTAQGDDESPHSRIRCPLCKWQPRASDRWFCGYSGPPENFIGCGTAWNTFDTRGVCPGCQHQWRWTACLRCHEYSLHEDWYAKDVE